MSAGARKAGLCGELNAELQENIWAGARDLIVVANMCSWALLPDPDALIPRTPGELMELAEVGVEYDREGRGFLHRLGQVNKRSEPTHPEYDLRYRGRTNVRLKSMSAFRSALREHMGDVHAVRAYLAGQPGEGAQWDSAAEWCRLANGERP